MKNFWLIFYYGIARFLPAYPIPGYKLGYQVRRLCCKHLFKKCGTQVLIKRNAYIGGGRESLLGTTLKLE